MSGGYEKAISEEIPHAEVCFDPFHMVRLAQRAVDHVRRDEWNAHERSHTPKGRWIKGTRWSTPKAPEKQKPSQLQLLAEVQQANRSLYRAFLLKEELRLLTGWSAPRSRMRTWMGGSPGRPDPSSSRS
jgi:transposase